MASWRLGARHYGVENKLLNLAKSLSKKLKTSQKLLLLALLVSYFFSKGLWCRIVLLFFVIPVPVLLNSFRIWATGILTINGRAELAENLFHDFTGWLVFMIAGTILFGVTLVLKRKIPKSWAAISFS